MVLRHTNTHCCTQKLDFQPQALFHLCLLHCFDQCPCGNNIRSKRSQNRLFHCKRTFDELLDLPEKIFIFFFSRAVSRRPWNTSIGVTTKRNHTRNAIKNNVLNNVFLFFFFVHAPLCHGTFGPKHN